MRIAATLAFRTTTALILLILATPVFAQPSLSSLWPLELGRSWEFDIRVEGPFDAVETGTRTETVAEVSEISPGMTVSCFNVVSSGVPTPLLLAVPPCGMNLGVLVDEGEALGVWNTTGALWEWWWMGSDLTPGSTFRLPIRTEATDDAFVNGEVRTLTGAVTTPAGSFSDAVIIDYLVELGQSEIVDGGGTVLGTASFEAVGWVAFVPSVGPVASEEAFAPATIDCPACPPTIYETITTSAELRSTTPVGTEERSFGSIKARY